MNDSIKVKKVHFTLPDALRLGYYNVKRRFGRTILLIVAIALGIAFFSAIFLMDAFFRVYAQTEGGTLQVETYQYWLVFISLAVCIVSVTNAMLIAVYERYKEIGVMKCLGALDRHILELFMAESTILGLIGGALGFLIGLVGAVISCAFTIGFNVILKIQSTVIASLLSETLLLSLILSIIATIYPAYKAAKLNPVEALRHEI